MERQSYHYKPRQVAEHMDNHNHPFDESSQLVAVYHPALLPASPPSYHAFERDFCSNFTCCGQSFPNLHVLLDHCEEYHTSVWGSSGNDTPIYPPPSHHLIMSDYRSSLSPSPSSISKNASSSDGSVSPSSTNVSEYLHSLSPFADVDALMLPYNAHEPDDDGILTLSKTIADCEFEFEFRKTQVWDSFLDGDDDDRQCKEDESASVKEVSPVGQGEVPFANTLSSAPMATAPPTAIEVHRIRSPEIPCEKEYPGFKSKRGNVTRERTFKCPRPGCIKAYLNPNGLKYHSDRGTCEFISTGGKQ